MISESSHGARFDLVGVVSNNATWVESWNFFLNNASYDLDGLSFELQFRGEPTDDSAALKLTTADGELTLSADTDGLTSILTVDVPYTAISSLDGDYVADLVSKDEDDALVHWAHGTVTFRKNPLAF